MKQENWQTAISTLKTQSDDLLRQYVCTVAESKLWPKDASPQDQQYIGYKEDEPELMTRMFRIYADIFYPDFVLDKTNLAAVEYLAKIAARKAEKRGIILHGPVGTGKTLLILLWTEFRQKIMTTTRDGRIWVMDHYKPGKVNAQFYSFTSGELIKIFIEKGEDRFSFLEKKFGDILILDDIGVKTEGNYFGAKTNVLAEIIYNRYNQFKQDPEMEIYATTNLLSKELTEVIGERAFSRLVEMAEWNKGNISGNDRRLGNSLVKVWPIIKKEKISLAPQELNTKLL